jgi:hypothetical protein
MDKNPLFNYSPKTMYVDSPFGVLQPINAPSSDLRPILEVPFDDKKKAIDLTPTYHPQYYSISPDYVKYIEKKYTYAYNSIFTLRKNRK